MFNEKLYNFFRLLLESIQYFARRLEPERPVTPPDVSFLVYLTKNLIHLILKNFKTNIFVKRTQCQAF